MDFDFSRIRTWTIPYGGAQRAVIKVVDGSGAVIWRRSYAAQPPAAGGGETRRLEDDGAFTAPDRDAALSAPWTGPSGDGA